MQSLQDFRYVETCVDATTSREYGSLFEQSIVSAGWIFSSLVRCSALGYVGSATRLVAWLARSLVPC